MIEREEQSPNSPPGLWQSLAEWFAKCTPQEADTPVATTQVSVQVATGSLSSKPGSSVNSASQRRIRRAVIISGLSSCFLGLLSIVMFWLLSRGEMTHTWLIQLFFPITAAAFVVMMLATRRAINPGPRERLAALQLAAKAGGSDTKALVEAMYIRNSEVREAVSAALIRALDRLPDSDKRVPDDETLVGLALSLAYKTEGGRGLNGDYDDAVIRFAHRIGVHRFLEPLESISRRSKSSAARAIVRPLRIVRSRLGLNNDSDLLLRPSAPAPDELLRPIVATSGTAPELLLRPRSSGEAGDNR